MEYEIEIVGAETEALHRQMHKALFGKMYTLGAVVFGVACLWAVWQCINTGSGKYAFLAVVYLVWAVWTWFRPGSIAKKNFESKLRYYDGAMPTGTVRFGEQITHEDIDSCITIPYDKVVRVDFLTDGILVITAQKKVYGFPNREFTKGSLKELKQLIRHKYPNIKIHE